MSTDQEFRTPKYMLALILMIVPLTGFVIDIYTPSLPAMTAYFGVDKSLVQLTITVELIAFGLFHTVSSTLSAVMGQRRILIPGMVILTIISFLVPFSPNITILLILRFLQGMFIAMPSSISKNLTSMHFEGLVLRRAANYMTIAWALGPIVAPGIGGLLQHYFNWRAPFLFLAIYCFICLIVLYYFLPRVEKPTHNLDVKQLLRIYGNLLRDKAFVSTAICCSGMYGLLIVFNVIGPFVVQKVLHYSALEFGYIAMLMGVAWLLGSTINRFFLEGQFSAANVLWGSMAAVTVVSLMMLILAVWVLNLGFVVGFCALILCIGSISYPNLLAEIFSLFRSQASIANGLMGSLNMLGAGVTSMFAATLLAKSAIPLSAMFFGLGLISLLCYHYFLQPRISHHYSR
jgi:predicted MFS family arabinose efflux permease